MITLKEWMELVNYRITEGTDFQWQCYGTNAHVLDSWNGIHGNGGVRLEVVFDTKDQTVYEACVMDYTNNQAYRLINPLFVEAYKAEAKTCGELATQVWDDVDYIDLYSVEDFSAKASAIIAGKQYDTCAEFTIDLPQDELFQLMKIAHERDITLNQLVEEILEATVAKFEAAQAKRWTIMVEENEDGESILPLPKDLLEQQGWNVGDVLVWTNNKDGTWSIALKA